MSKPSCTCYFCQTGKEHSPRHTEYAPVSSHLLVAESLDPDHRIHLVACSTCGHVKQADH